MAPAKTTHRRVVKTAESVTPATFDFEDFLNGFQRPEFSATLIRRTDLMPQLAERLKVLDELDDRIDRLERAEGDDGAERDITAVNPLAELTDRRNRLTLEYNDLAQVYNDSAVEFTFRVPDQKDDHMRIQAMMDEVGLTQPEQPTPHDTGVPEVDAQLNAAEQKAYEEAFTAWWDALAIRSMAVTCIRHPGTALGAAPLTLQQWEALRAKVGQGAFNTLGSAWFAAVQAVAPSAPFSPRPLPTPETPE